MSKFITFGLAGIFLFNTQVFALTLDIPAVTVLKALAQLQLNLMPAETTQYYKKCRDLFAAGMEQQAIDFAAVTMDKFIAAEDDTPGLVLGSFQTDKHLIYVVYNMGPRERRKVRMAYPYSFHIYTLDTPPAFLRRIDWEINYSPASQPITAALGEMVKNVHVNYGGLDVDADFATVKALVLATLENAQIHAATVLASPNDPKFLQYQEFMKSAYPSLEHLLGEPPRAKNATPPAQDAPKPLPPEVMW